MTTATANIRSMTASDNGDTAARIGPNSVIRTLQAIRELEDSATASTLATRAGLSESEPTEMIPEAWFVRLIDAVRSELPADRSAAILARAGSLTADYVAANRIPAIVRGLLHFLPSRLAVPLLLAAFQRHAWTFAGQSHYRVEGTYPGEIVLDNAPTCRSTNTNHLSGEYYAAAFEGLLSLACPHVRVVEVACRSDGASHCRFAIHTTRCSDTG